MKKEEREGKNRRKERSLLRKDCSHKNRDEWQSGTRHEGKWLEGLEKNVYPTWKEKEPNKIKVKTGDRKEKKK